MNTPSTGRATKVMLLIDADNVTADVIEQAVPLVIERHGAAHVRRAYCTAELALKQLKLFKAHSIRPIVNISTGKNSTDIALAVDAMDLADRERPDVVVIVSSDSDFAPLVIRLREKGCRVEGIGQEGKTGEDSKPVYDDFTDLMHRKARPASGRSGGGRGAGPRAAARSVGGTGPSRGAASASGPARGPGRGDRGPGPGAGVAPSDAPGGSRSDAGPRSRSGRRAVVSEAVFPATVAPWPLTALQPTAVSASVPSPAPSADRPVAGPRAEVEVGGDAGAAASAAMPVPLPAVDAPAPAKAPAARKRTAKAAAAAVALAEAVQASEAAVVPAGLVGEDRPTGVPQGGDADATAAPAPEAPAVKAPRGARAATKRAAAKAAAAGAGADAVSAPSPDDAPAVTRRSPAAPAAPAAPAEAAAEVTTAFAADPASVVPTSPRRRPARGAAKATADALVEPMTSDAEPLRPRSLSPSPVPARSATGQADGGGRATPRPARLPDEVARILAALPELRSGARMQLNLAKERLFNAGLLARSAPSTKLFRKHPTLFALLPPDAPNKVQFLASDAP